jgi:hypothetical protein
MICPSSISCVLKRPTAFRKLRIPDSDQTDRSQIEIEERISVDLASSPAVPEAARDGTALLCFRCDYVGLLSTFRAAPGGMRF